MLMVKPDPSRFLFLGATLALLMVGAKDVDAQVSGGSTCMDSTTAPILLYNSLGARPVGHASIYKPSPNAAYAHAFFLPIPNNMEYQSIVRIGGILKLDGVFITRNGTQYEQWTISLQGQAISHVRDTLVKSFCSLFFNVEPYTFEDKLSAKIAGLVPSDSWDHYDTATGKLRAYLRFFGDVPAEAKDSLVTAYFGVQDSLDFYPGTVVATREQLLAFATEEIVQSVYEMPSNLIPSVRPRLLAPHDVSSGTGEFLRHFDLLGRSFRKAGE